MDFIKACIACMLKNAYEGLYGSHRAAFAVIVVKQCFPRLVTLYRLKCTIYCAGLCYVEDIHEIRLAVLK